MLTNIYKTVKERAQAMGIATDLPFQNRADRRRNLKRAIKEEKLQQKTIIKSIRRKFVGKKEAA